MMMFRAWPFPIIVVSIVPNTAAAQTTADADVSAELRLDFAVPSPSSIPPLSLTPDETEAELPADPFANGSRYWTLTTGISRDAHIGRVYLTQFSIDNYLADDFAFRWGATLGYADPDKVDGGVQGGPEIGIRWHFFTRERFSVYFDSSVAAVFHQNPLTEDSMRFNFDVQAGVGASLQLGHDAHLLSGIRWHHLSNARIHGKEHNLGYDGPMLYFGFMKAF